MWNRTLEDIFGNWALDNFLVRYRAYDLEIEDIVGENALEIFELIKVWDNQEYHRLSVSECDDLFTKHGFYLVK